MLKLLSDTWTLDELIASIGNVDRASAVKSLATWVNMGVLKEAEENVFVLLENVEEGSEMKDVGPPGMFTFFVPIFCIRAYIGGVYSYPLRDCRSRPKYPATAS